MVDHSCAPNAHWHHNGKEMIIRTIDKVEDFSKIRHSYLKILTANTKKRREKLLQDHYFLCECPKCLNTDSDILKNSTKCQNCEGCVPISKGTCIKCEQKISENWKEKYKKLKKSLNKIIANPDGFGIDDKLYNDAKETFHPFDTVFTEFLNIYIFEQIDAKNYAKCLEMTKFKLAHLYQHLPKYEMNIGDQEIQAAKFCTFLGKSESKIFCKTEFEREFISELIDEAEEHLAKAKDIFEVIFGKDHPILTKEWKSVRNQIDEKKLK